MGRYRARNGLGTEVVKNARQSKIAIHIAHRTARVRQVEVHPVGQRQELSSEPSGDDIV